MRRICLAGLLIAMGTGTILCAPQQDKAAPQELIQFVRTARGNGALEAKIRQDALAAGWPSEVVDQAMASPLSGAPNKPPAQPASKAGPASSPTASSSPAAPVQAPAGAAGEAPRADQPPPPSAKDRGVPDDYRIGAGDALQIAVWKEPDASVPNVVVRPDGKIAMPLIKEVEVVGLTPTQVEKNITERLDKFINGVDVTVIVTRIESKKIYLLGGVKKEGPIPYTYRMSVMQAISEAGGLTDYAKRRKIYILRNEGGKDYRLPFDFEEVLKGEKMEQNIQLLAGDTVVVPQ
jgi:polysaccharide export outer membrane protein